MSDGSRIDNRQRGNAHQLHEKYKTLARDAQMQGDRVQAEYYLQFSDHYFRILAEQRGRQEEVRPRPRDQMIREDAPRDEFGNEVGEADRIDLAGLPGPARLASEADADEAGDNHGAAENSDDGERRSRGTRRVTRPRAEVPAIEAPQVQSADDGEAIAAETPTRRPVRRARKVEAEPAAAAPELFAEGEQQTVEAPRRRGRPRRRPEEATVEA